MTMQTPTSIDILAYGEPMVEFNQTGQGDARCGTRRSSITPA
jgi:hypothetical protein